MRDLVLLRLRVAREAELHLLREAVQEEGHVVVRGVDRAHQARVEPGVAVALAVPLGRQGDADAARPAHPLAEGAPAVGVGLQRLEHRVLHVLALLDTLGREGERVGVADGADDAVRQVRAWPCALDGLVELLVDLFLLLLCVFVRVCLFCLSVL